MSPSAAPLLQRLEGWLSQWHSAVVSYSGGVDSAVVLAVARRVLGERAMGCLAASPSLAAREREAAIELARIIGADCRVIETAEHDDPRYAANPADRCYFCKRHWYARIRKMADGEGWQVVLDGTNADDLGEDRPGRLAGQEMGVRSPLAELGIAKPQVRELARDLGLSVWNKPSMACLASRIPHGTAITAGLLHQVERAEDALAALGFRQFRVRHHGELARVELPPEDLARAVAGRERIVAGVGAAGYKYVCLDLAGFRGTPSRPAGPPGLAAPDKLVP